MTVSVLGDTFADVVCRPLENLPEWGKVREFLEFAPHRSASEAHECRTDRAVLDAFAAYFRSIRVATCVELSLL